ncbi:hypothetical protein SLS62_000735 [Diatrype stigma]|uniref:Ilp is an apoptosis inhibitor n=1 Tax=Diatrype stigma TaxID=117547 RepID=A0AAN9V107_9PEZI
MAFPPPPPGGGGGPPSFPIIFQPPQPGSASTSARGLGPDNPPAGHFIPIEHTQFDILEWYPHFQSCVRYFLDHAQHSGPVQAVAAFVNIQLPFQKHPPVVSSRPTGSPSSMPSPTSRSASKLPMTGQPLPTISLNPYIRRLVATGFDFPAILHGFFGDDWAAGISHLHEVERRNYLFAAKSASWLDVKSQYDMPDDQSIPFLRPLQNVEEKEIVSAESNWSEWLAMQDWMVGPRSPEVPVVVKTEEA